MKPKKKSGRATRPAKNKALAPILTKDDGSPVVEDVAPPPAPPPLAETAPLAVRPPTEVESPEERARRMQEERFPQEIQSLLQLFTPLGWGGVIQASGLTPQYIGRKLKDLMEDPKGAVRLAAIRFFMEHTKEALLMGGLFSKAVLTAASGNKTLTVETTLPSGVPGLGDETEALLNAAVAGSPSYAATEKSLEQDQDE